MQIWVFYQKAKNMKICFLALYLANAFTQQSIGPKYSLMTFQVVIDHTVIESNAVIPGFQPVRCQQILQHTGQHDVQSQLKAQSYSELCM